LKANLAIFVVIFSMATLALRLPWQWLSNGWSGGLGELLVEPRAQGALLSSATSLVVGMVLLIIFSAMTAPMKPRKSSHE
jgi:hypothetical protein